MVIIFSGVGDRTVQIGLGKSTYDCLPVMKLLGRPGLEEESQQCASRTKLAERLPPPAAQNQRSKPTNSTIAPTLCLPALLGRFLF